MTVICYHCGQDRKKLTTALCPDSANGHYFVRKTESKTDHAQRKIPRLEKEGKQLKLFRDF